MAVATLVFLSAGPASAENPRTGAPDSWPEAIPPMLNWFLLADQLEYRLNDGEAHTEGPHEGDAELQLLYGYNFAPFWDFQVGARQDFLFGPGPNRERTFAAIGVEGLAPLWFEVSPTLFVSDDGDVSARLTATYDVLLTQRLIAQSRLELNVAASDAKKFGVASGFNDVELGLRLRYEIRREFAPYIGVNWIRQLGDTATLARRGGADTSVVGFVAGLRMWL